MEGLLSLATQDKVTGDKGSLLYLENKVHFPMRGKEALSFVDIRVLNVQPEPYDLRIWAVKMNSDHLIHTYNSTAFKFLYIYHIGVYMCVYLCGRAC